MYKLFKTSAETFAKNKVWIIIGGENKLRLKNKDIGEKLGVKNIYDLIDKEIKSKFNTTEQ